MPFEGPEMGCRILGWISSDALAKLLEVKSAEILPLVDLLSDLVDWLRFGWGCCALFGSGLPSFCKGFWTWICWDASLSGFELGHVWESRLGRTFLTLCCKFSTRSSSLFPISLFWLQALADLAFSSVFNFWPVFGCTLLATGVLTDLDVGLFFSFFPLPWFCLPWPAQKTNSSQGNSNLPFINNVCQEVSAYECGQCKIDSSGLLWHVMSNSVSAVCSDMNFEYCFGKRCWKRSTLYSKCIMNDQLCCEYKVS